MDVLRSRRSNLGWLNGLVRRHEVIVPENSLATLDQV